MQTAITTTISTVATMYEVSVWGSPLLDNCDGTRKASARSLSLLLVEFGEVLVKCLPRHGADRGKAVVVRNQLRLGFVLDTLVGLFALSFVQLEIHGLWFLGAWVWRPRHCR